MGFARGALAGLLVLVAALLAPVALAARWADHELTDTDTYVSDVGPLADDPAFQDAVAQRIGAAVLRRSGSGGGGAASDAVYAAARVAVASDLFADLWVAGQRAAHQQLAASLTEGGVAAPLIVDLAPVVASVQASLVASGLLPADRVRDAPAEVTVLDADRAAQARDHYDSLHRAATWGPVAVVALLLLALVLARSRRRVLVAAGLGVALTAALLLVAQVVGRDVFVQVTDELPGAAARAVYDALTGSLVGSTRVVCLGAAVVGVAAWLAGLVTRRRTAAPAPGE